MSSRASNTEDALLSELYQVYQDESRKLLGFIYRFTRNPEDCQDILQDVFRKAHEAMLAGRVSGDHIKAWLYKIAHNEAVNFVNRAKNYRAKIDEMKGDNFAGFENRLLDKMELDQVDRFVSESFTDREQMIFRMRFYQELTVTEIGTAMDLSPGQISRIIKELIRKIRVFFNKKSGG